MRYLNVGELPRQSTNPGDLVLLTNDRGGMARLRVDLGRIESNKILRTGANLHSTLPSDRHIFVKRIRAWVNADGFITPLDFRCLDSCSQGPPARWEFVANAGDGRTVQVQVAANMVQGYNATVFQFRRPTAANATGKQLPANADVRLTVRFDIEDRNFHWETKRNGGLLPFQQQHTYFSDSKEFNVSSSSVGEQRAVAGFAFTPAADRQLRIYTSAGDYHPKPEWSESIPHPVEQSRGQTGQGDAFSPGWFDIALPKGSAATLIVTADEQAPGAEEIARAMAGRSREAQLADEFLGILEQAARAFVVRRGKGKTVIAGYPWFLDWGRDTFIAARGLLAAGMHEEVKEILLTFARFEKNGTLLTLFLARTPQIVTLLTRRYGLELSARNWRNSFPQEPGTRPMPDFMELPLMGPGARCAMFFKALPAITFRAPQTGLEWMQILL